ncbi:hypothetical protein ACWDKQ_24560 [Saccharopolyspora sp. NPDC000995]
MKSSFRSVVRGVAISSALGAALVIGQAGIAQAATPGVFKLCSGGNFDSFATFTERGGFSTFVVRRGTCQSFKYGGTHAERVDVKVANTGKYIGSLAYDGRVGANVRTVNGPSFYTF